MEKTFAIALGIVTADKERGGYPSLEYDNVSLETVIADVKRLQKKYKLGKCVVVKTMKGYHVHFFWDNGRSWEEILQITEDSLAPSDFKEMTRAIGKRVIRISGKYKTPDLKVIGIIDSEYEGYGDKTIGDAYLCFFTKLLNIKLPDFLLVSKEEWEKIEKLQATNLA